MVVAHRAEFEIAPYLILLDLMCMFGGRRPGRILWLVVFVQISGRSGQFGGPQNPSCIGDRCDRPLPAMSDQNPYCRVAASPLPPSFMHEGGRDCSSGV